MDDELSGLARGLVAYFLPRYQPAPPSVSLAAFRPRERLTMPRRDWTREETLVALNVYCRTPFGRLHGRNPEIIRIAAALGRTPDALASDSPAAQNTSPTRKRGKWTSRLCRPQFPRLRVGLVSDL